MTPSSPVDFGEVQKRLAGVRPDLPPSTTAYRAAVLLMCGPAWSFNVDRMTRITKYPAFLVAVAARRLFDNGVWQHTGAVYTWHTPADTDFWLDVAVAEGKLQRRRNRTGHLVWTRAGALRHEHEDVAAHETELPGAGREAVTSRETAGATKSPADIQLFPNARWL